MEPKKIQLIGYACIGIASVLAITSTTLAGVTFNYTNLTWTNNSWAALGGSQLAAVIFIWIIIGMSALAFITLSKISLLIFLLLNIISLLFTLGISIFSFIATSSGGWNERNGCNAEYQGIWEGFQSVDIYLQAVDSLLCSSRCPCKLDEAADKMFSSNTATIPYYSQWTTSDKSYNHYTKFQDCPNEVIAEASNIYFKHNAYYYSTFNPSQFQTYFRNIEMAFNCSGFCSTTYFNYYSHTTTKIVKYLFNDISKYYYHYLILLINRGVPRHEGCLFVLLPWLHHTVNSFASVNCFLVLVQLIMCWVSNALLTENVIKNNIDDNISEKEKEKEKTKEKTKEKKKEKTKGEDSINSKQKENLEKEEQKLKDTIPIKEKFKEDTPNKDAKDINEKANENEPINFMKIPLDSSFIPPDAMKAEQEIKFNPSG